MYLYCILFFISIQAAGWHYCAQKNKCLPKSHNFTVLHLYKNTYKTIDCVGVWDREVLTKCQCVLLWHVCNANYFFSPNEHQQECASYMHLHHFKHKTQDISSCEQWEYFADSTVTRKRMSSLDIMKIINISEYKYWKISGHTQFFIWNSKYLLFSHSENDSENKVIVQKLVFTRFWNDFNLPTNGQKHAVSWFMKQKLSLKGKTNENWVHPMIEQIVMTL